MKKKKNIIILILIVIILILISVISVFIYKRISDESKLNLNENKWLESNKYNVIDIALINDIPVLNYNGDGLVYEYLNYLTDNLSLKFNIIPYKSYENIDYKYKMLIVDKVGKNDIELLKDNLVLLTNSDLEYENVSQITNLRIGVLKGEKETLEKYLDGQNITFIEYDTTELLKNALSESKNKVKENVMPDIDGIIILRNLITKEIIENNYKISFKFNNLNKYFVLRLNGDNELNNILIKKYDLWKENNFDKAYSDSFLKYYFDVKKISDAGQKELKSKSYQYGFIDYGIYNNLQKNKISGLNSLVLKDFNKKFGVSITYTKYNSLNKLIKDFGSKKVDFMFNMANMNDIGSFNTVGVFKKDFIIISDINNKYPITDINSLKTQKVLTIKYSMIEQYLINNGIKVESYNNLKELTKDFGKNDIVFLDLANYDYYKSSVFMDSKINYVPYNLGGKYNYIINNTQENKIFEELFDFYLNYTSIDDLINTNYDSIAYEHFDVTYLLLILIIVLLIYVIIDFSSHLKVMIKKSRENKKIHLTKEEKLKYIDQLTSLKNRAYLNSKIEIWDQSEVYPQAIVIIDLNNISYINDNYGREEGDKVITEAANILILEQLKNSEIIRTDGNEFLIYLVGYNEKQIVSYLRKLNKQFKGLSHGFGAASGYSIITDAIKTIDDAVNEATISMKEQKEDIDY